MGGTPLSDELDRRLEYADECTEDLVAENAELIDALRNLCDAWQGTGELSYAVSYAVRAAQTVLAKTTSEKEPLTSQS